MAVGGHFGVKNTLERIRRVFYWQKMKWETYKFVAKCDICKRNKVGNIVYMGLLQPLPIPKQI